MSSTNDQFESAVQGLVLLAQPDARVAADLVADWVEEEYRRVVREAEPKPPMADDEFCMETMNADHLRGYDYGCKGAAVALQNVLDGTDSGAGTSHEPWQAQRQRVLDLKRDAERYRVLREIPVKLGEGQIAIARELLDALVDQYRAKS